MCPPAHEIIIEIAINKYHTFSPLDCNNHYTHMMRMRTTMTRTISTTTINMTAKQQKVLHAKTLFFCIFGTIRTPCQGLSGLLVSCMQVQ